MCVCVARACVRACVCVLACVHACVCVWVGGGVGWAEQCVEELEMLPAGTKSRHNALDHLSWCESAGGVGGGERGGKEGVKSKSTIFPGGARNGYRHSDRHYNCFKSNTWRRLQ